MSTGDQIVESLKFTIDNKELECILPVSEMDLPWKTV